MEKFEGSPFDKVVGVPTKDQEYQEEVERYAGRLVKEWDTEKVKDLEVEKTPREIELISFAANSVNEFIKEYGRENDFELPLEKIHVLKEGGVKEFSDGEIEKGLHRPISRSVYIDRQKTDIAFVLSVFHEFFHGKSYSVIQLKATEKPEERALVPFRSGLTAVSRDGKTVYFNDFEEGVVSLMERRFYEEKVKTNPQFSEELRQMDENGETHGFSRTEELTKLNELVDDLYEKNKQDYGSRQEVLDLFIKGQINGSLLSIAKLIEKTYGKGSFRELAEKNKFEVALSSEKESSNDDSNQA